MTRIRFKGRIDYEETRKRKSEAKKGKPLLPRSAEHARKLGLSHVGLKHTDESKLKMSKSRKGVKKPDDFGAKVAARMKGSHASESTKCYKKN